MIMKDQNVFIQFTIIGYDITTETTFARQGLLKNNYMYRESEVVLVVSLLFCEYNTVFFFMPIMQFLRKCFT